MITGLDHLVLTVRSLEASADFYGRVLGGERRNEPGRPTAILFGGQKLNLHAVDHTFEPKAACPTPGAGDLCLLTELSPEAVIGALAAGGVTVERGPVPRTGARGPMTSVYCRDPDGNLVEIASYQDAGTGSPARQEPCMAEPTLGASITAGPLGIADAMPGPPPPVAFFGSRRVPAEPSAASSEGRPLRQYERAAAHAVFRDALRLDGIRIKESRLMSLGGYYRTLPETIYIIPHEEIPLRILIHELTHAAQYQHGVSSVGTISLAIVGIFHDVYDYGGEAGLRKAVAERKCFTDFSYEQQGDIVQHYFERLIAGQPLDPWSVYIEQVRAGFRCVWPADPSPPARH